MHRNAVPEALGGGWAPGKRAICEAQGWVQARVLPPPRSPDHAAMGGGAPIAIGAVGRSADYVSREGLGERAGVLHAMRG